MEAVRVPTDALCLNLEKTLKLIADLTSTASEKETALSAGDIENLRGATEREEELIAELGKLEKDRELCAGALSKAIGLFDTKVPLSKLIELLQEGDNRRRLTVLKDKLRDGVNALTSQNEKLRQLLTLQIGYTEYMLNLMYIPKARSHTYNIQGSRKDVSGELSLLDFHV